MSRRVLAAVVLGVLLPVPLVLLLSGSWRGMSPATGVGASTLSPVLSVEERRQLLTFERACERREDCESPLGCLRGPTGRALCVASECQTDLQCEQGRVCRTLRTLDNGPLVRSCELAGTAREGEPCSEFATQLSSACEAGLICNTHCGRPCKLEDSSSCAEGFFCAEGSPEGPSCLPTCRGRACPEGQRCVAFRGGLSVCATLHGEDCEQVACPQGQECRTAYVPGQPGRVKRECVTRCDEQRPCPQGRVCHAGNCHTPCDVDAASPCGPDQRCVFFPVARRWFCALKG
jgi:hypothetical protein